MTTKIHAVVEGLGQLERWSLTPGQTHDVMAVPHLLSDLRAASIAADRAYDTDGVLSAVAACGAQAVIPPKKTRLVQRPFDQQLYKNRNLIKRFFCRIKQFRRIATRYDIRASRFSAFIAIAATFIWLA